MTRKHFISLAFQMSVSRPEKKGVRRQQWVKDCKHVANACQVHNNNFDRDKFLLACGLTDKEIKG